MPRPLSDMDLLSNVQERLSSNNSDKKDQLILELCHKNVSWQQYSSQQEAYVMKVMEEYQALQQENKNLQQELRLKTEELNSANSEILVLREQANSYAEDFASERKDRERAQSRLDDLETEYELTKRHLQQYELQHMQSIGQRRQAALELHKIEYERKHPNHTVVSDDVVCDGDDELDSGQLSWTSNNDDGGRRGWFHSEGEQHSGGQDVTDGPVNNHGVQQSKLNQTPVTQAANDDDYDII